MSPSRMACQWKISLLTAIALMLMFKVNRSTAIHQPAISPASPTKFTSADKSDYTLAYFASSFLIIELLNILCALIVFFQPESSSGQRALHCNSVTLAMFQFSVCMTEVFHLWSYSVYYSKALDDSGTAVATNMKKLLSLGWACGLQLALDALFFISQFKHSNTDNAKAIQSICGAVLGFSLFIIWSMFGPSSSDLPNAFRNWYIAYVIVANVLMVYLLFIMGTVYLNWGSKGAIIPWVFLSAINLAFCVALFLIIQNSDMEGVSDNAIKFLFFGTVSMTSFSLVAAIVLGIRSRSSW